MGVSSLQITSSTKGRDCVSVQKIAGAQKNKISQGLASSDNTACDCMWYGPIMLSDGFHQDVSFHRTQIKLDTQAGT